MTTIHTVLIPLNQGLFLNPLQITARLPRTSLNPFESGSVFKPTVFSADAVEAWRLNPFESGSVFKPCRPYSRFAYPYCLNPFESGSVFKLRKMPKIAEKSRS